jgi:hypothetical protein
MKKVVDNYEIVSYYKEVKQTFINLNETKL